MASPRLPQHDSYPIPPEDWVDIPLGAGQSPSAYGGNGSFKWNAAADAGTTGNPNDVKRDGNPILFISRPPERW